jgi:alpha-mannosidase
MYSDADMHRLRLERFVRERVMPAVYPESRTVDIEAWTVHGEPVPFDFAIAQQYEPFPVGGRWGKAWDTTWFHVRGTVPPEWQGRPVELVMDLGYDGKYIGFQSEGIAYRTDGTIVKAIEPINSWVPIDAGATEFEFYIEAAANPNIGHLYRGGISHLGDPATIPETPIYDLKAMQVSVLATEVWELVQDIWTLSGLAAELPPTLPRTVQILTALDRMIDAMDPDDIVGSAARGRAELAGVLASPAYASAHRSAAVGHAHIDSAWLWPARETVRKVARTFSNVVDLMDRDPDFVFAASSAQQYAWLKASYPAVYEKVKARVAEGRFIPVGGTWVENDTNMPGGEALARQFVAGKRFFMEEFGVEPLEVWFPDSFGYSGALPQIAKAAGSKWMLSQKMSWNERNLFPHHTFEWEGIDGTRIFTHFPPSDTYSSEISGRELARAERQFAEKAGANTSLLLFGWGDGGGGPTREILAAAARTRSLEGSPTVEMRTPREFFEIAEAEYVDPPVWMGELYLEFHRGTYTSQSKTKRGNRVSEALLRQAELWATTAAVRSGAAYPYETFEEQWRTVLLQQFHDILPGSSIAWVHQEAERNYARVAEVLEGEIGTSLRALVGAGDEAIAVNAGPYSRAGIPSAGAVSVAGASGAVLAEAHAPVRREGDRIVLENALTRAVLDAQGRLVSLVDLATGRDAVPAGEAGNVLQLFRDTPRQFDAWDIDEDDKRTLHELEAPSVEIDEDGVTVRVVHATEHSRIEQTLRLHDETGALDTHFEIDWHEKQKLLKLAFPLAVRTDRATSEIQFGHLHRATHANTSWDVARFETVAHRWIQVGEPSFGVAISNHVVYGHDIRNTRSAAGEAITTARLSLLRAPLYPDPESDQGRHEFDVSILAGADIPTAITEGYRRQLPLRVLEGAQTFEPLFASDAAGVVIETVKLAEDRSGDVVVRLYEAHGDRSRAGLTADFDWSSVVATDLLERPLEGVAVSAEGRTVSLDLRPFELVTLRFTR